MNFSNIKAVIPARYGSSRLPGKPLLLIREKPMFWHVAQRCIDAGIDINNIIIATDDQRIIDEAGKLNLLSLITSAEHHSGTDRVNEVANILEWSKETIVLNVQGDEPLLPSELIKTLSTYIVNNPEFSITTAVTPIVKREDFINSNVVKAILGSEGRALYFTRSPAPFNRDNSEDISLAYRHVGIYAYTVESLKLFCSFPEAPLESYEKLEQLRALSNGLTIGACVFHQELPHGVDTVKDYKIIKEIMER
ncbi:3-deoxy-manno-octulosonate cytidylyltransferase [Pseudocolwellia sp. AS88]|uniref:3-deoxy-manno-octulosonate cytidylyltransferase n=1 Tax=Pseudocolwellia sp. AS88 TaxID=3063958 RepID=UPI0026EB7B53|nr:3-deoxy-manno-octulosonate cytidylyltransferase [Pseudocolwellia sp. AS88]MDO7085030.1 3-deoxy-manno-octulosonate cytidylyltransferase [Pseudocolwellia sp. AS88]